MFTLTSHFTSTPFLIRPSTIKGDHTSFVLQTEEENFLHIHSRTAGGGYTTTVTTAPNETAATSNAADAQGRHVALVT